MNYGYEPTKNDLLLANELCHALDIPPIQYRKHHGPYVEINGFYAGVRIRRITALTQEDLDKLISMADSVHKRITEDSTTGKT